MPDAGYRNWKAPEVTSLPGQPDCQHEVTEDLFWTETRQSSVKATAEDGFLCVGIKITSTCRCGNVHTMLYDTEPLRDMEDLLQYFKTAKKIPKKLRERFENVAVPRDMSEATNAEDLAAVAQGLNDIEVKPDPEELMFEEYFKAAELPEETSRWGDTDPRLKQSKNTHHLAPEAGISFRLVNRMRTGLSYQILSEGGQVTIVILPPTRGRS